MNDAWHVFTFGGKEYIFLTWVLNYAVYFLKPGFPQIGLEK